MSLRSTILRQSGSLVRPRSAFAARGIATSSPRRAGHGHEEHGSSAGAGEEDVYTSESFFSPAWRNTIIFVTASILIYPYLPSPSTGSASPSLSPDTFYQLKTGKDESLPYVTKVLAKITPESKVWTERNERHLELSREAADTKLLFQEAERPKVWRMRNPGSFDAASPHNIAVGSQVDLSDLKIRTE